MTTRHHFSSTLFFSGTTVESITLMSSQSDPSPLLHESAMSIASVSTAQPYSASCVVLSTGAHSEQGCLVRRILYPTPLSFKFNEHLKIVFLHFDVLLRSDLHHCPGWVQLHGYQCLLRPLHSDANTLATHTSGFCQWAGQSRQEVEEE